jgi:hypothetical protein
MLKTAQLLASNPHTNGFFNSVHVTQCHFLTKKLQRMPKDKKKTQSEQRMHQNQTWL